MRKLRIAHIVVQTVLVYDDGEELSPGPEVHPVQVSLSQLARLIDTLPGEVAKLDESTRVDSAAGVNSEIN